MHSDFSGLRPPKTLTAPEARAFATLATWTIRHCLLGQYARNYMATEYAKYTLQFTRDLTIKTSQNEFRK